MVNGVLCLSEVLLNFLHFFFLFFILKNLCLSFFKFVIFWFVCQLKSAVNLFQQNVYFSLCHFQFQNVIWLFLIISLSLLILSIAMKASFTLLIMVFCFSFGHICNCCLEVLIFKTDTGLSQTQLLFPHFILVYMSNFVLLHVMKLFSQKLKN